MTDQGDDKTPQSESKTTRRDLMRPVQLLLIAFLCAVFAGGITAVSAGGFQTLNKQGLARPIEDISQAWVLGGVVAGITFIAVLLLLSMLLLAIDPNQITKPVDRPVLLPDEDEAAAGESGDASTGRRPSAH